MSEHPPVYGAEFDVDSLKGVPDGSYVKIKHRHPRTTGCYYGYSPVTDGYQQQEGVEFVRVLDTAGGPEWEKKIKEVYAKATGPRNATVAVMQVKRLRGKKVPDGWRHWAGWLFRLVASK